MGSKPPDPAPTNPVSIKRGRFDTANSPKMVYVRRKIDHDQQHKPSLLSETPKNSAGESAKEPNLEECHETNRESELNESKGVVPNQVEHIENDSSLNPIGNQVELQSDPELHELKVGASTVSPADVATEPKLDSELPKKEVVSPIEVNEEKEHTLSSSGEKSEPDLVCHETNLDSDLVELKAIPSNQVTSPGARKEIEPKLDPEFQQQEIVAPNQVANRDEDENLGNNEPKLSSIPSNQARSNSNIRSCGRENYRERFAKLQEFLKDCDRSRQDDYIRMLRSLSAVGRSKHAVELEKRAMELLMEEGKELRRMNNLHILGKDWLKDKVSVSGQTNFHRQL